MSRWFRHYAGLARDEKMVRVAIQSDQPLERVVWVWIALLESAAERNGDGEYDAFSAEMAYFLRCPKEDIEAILSALQVLGRIDDGRISNWSQRQYKGDSSTERVKRYREARKERGLVAQWQPSKSLRAEIYARDNHQCVYCGAVDDLTIDHRTPEMHGGDHSPENLQTCCRKCNAKKRDLTHEEFVARNGVTVPETRHRQKTETDIPLANANGAEPEIDPVKVMFDSGVSLIRQSGKSESHARSWLGKAKSAYGTEAVIAAIGTAKREGAIDPISFMQATLKARERQLADAWVSPC